MRAVLILAIALTACGGADTGERTAADWVEEYGGVETVYSEIASERDCDALQETFDRAADNNDGAEPGTAEHQWTLGYMTASDERMQEVGCYD